jgi:ATP:ADP antiporter, AAA family
MPQQIQHAETGPMHALLRRIVDVRRGEVLAMFLASAYFFFVLSSYYILRPIRDEMGVAGGVENVPWLFLGTLIAMLLVNPLFSTLVAKYPRKRFVPYAYRFFAANLVLFFVLLAVLPAEHGIWIGRAFFIWVSVFNLFVVSIFWAFLADIFRSDQGKRLFGFIGVGGTIGGVSGSAITAALVGTLGVTNLLLVSALFLEVAVQFVLWLNRLSAQSPAVPALRGYGGTGSAPATPDDIVDHRPAHDAPATPATVTPDATQRDTPAYDRAIGGSALEGIREALRSPFLLGIVAFMLLFTIGSTFLYFQRLSLVAEHFTDRETRVAFFARIDLIVNVLTLITQAYFTARLIRWLGVGWTLALVPAISVLGFLALGLAPTLFVLVAFESLRRAGNFAVARPTRELLYTVVSRADRYKAKSFIDTFVYRLGDQIGNWSWALMNLLGFGIVGVSFVAAPIMGLWLAVALWLGVQYRRREQAEPVVAPASTSYSTSPRPS